ncbi:hypothetical protein [Streptomyces leeuwenhoekii]|uniref:Sle1_079 protein n=1 Tax=Streptomyces leeuwenhoekii TaxID=1437453 RepID=A0A0F7VR13_STRLW|nr:hypothetical protein [Streptomyces leeuwenhoekii]CQR59246.1 sle1_079 [Streptomyces leeuwenhoekii]
MTVQHEMSWERDTTEYVDDNNWVISEQTGATAVFCSCGFQRIVADQDTQRTIDEHKADVAEGANDTGDWERP